VVKDKHAHLTETHLTVTRPWGSYTILEEGPYYKIKRIMVNPGAKLSMQMHYHRSEHWVVIEGTARIANGEQDIYLEENQSTYIPKTHRHRLENPGRVPLQIIEIQTGPYLEEDDIVRFDDVYGRIPK
jgi:mannose-1-phosphate guanylyltransferase / mannose-6-phosphate isomerase